MSDESLDDRNGSRPRLGFLAGTIVIVEMLLVPYPESLSQEVWSVAAV